MPEPRHPVLVGLEAGPGIELVPGPAMVRLRAQLDMDPVLRAAVHTVGQYTQRHTTLRAALARWEATHSTAGPTGEREAAEELATIVRATLGPTPEEYARLTAALAGLPPMDPAQIRHAFDRPAP
jgi:hypothetical protein